MAKFQRDHGGIELGRYANADDEERRNADDEAERQKIGHRARRGYGDFR